MIELSPVDRVEGTAISLRGNNIDTDRIIPARYLREITFEGLGPHAFEDDRRALNGAHPLDDPRFAGAGERREHKAELDRLVRDWARTRTRQEIWDAVRDLGYFGAPVLSKAEVLDDTHIKARNAFIERDHPSAGPTTLLAPWIHMSQTPASIRDDAPAIGQHTDEVLGGLLGLTEAELEDLRAAGAIR